MKVNLHRCGAHYEGACGAQRDQGLIRNGYLRTGACCLHAGCSSLTWTVHKGVWVCLRLEFDSCIGQVYFRRFFRSPASPRAQPRRQTRDWGRVLQSFTDVRAHFLTYVVARAVSAASSQDDTATTAHQPRRSARSCGFPKPLPNTPNIVLECNNCPVREAVRSGARSLRSKNWLLKKPVTRLRMPKPTSCCSKLRATVGLRPR